MMRTMVTMRSAAMKTGTRRAAALAALVGGLAACAPAPAPPPAPGSTGATAPPGATSSYLNPTAGSVFALQIPGMHAVPVRTEKYGEAAFDLYLPEAPKAPPPVVVLLHGVAPDPSPKDFGGFVGWGQALAMSGLAAVVPDYRAGETAAEPGRSDVAAVLARVRADAAALGVDGSRIAVVGFSAGGPHAVAAAFDQPAVKALALFYAVTEPDFGPDTARHSLTARLAERPDVPVFLAHGAQDRVQAVRRSQEAFEAASAGKGWPVTAVEHPSAGHAFDAVSPDERSEAIVRQAIAFLTERLDGT